MAFKCLWLREAHFSFPISLIEPFFILYSSHNSYMSNKKIFFQGDLPNSPEKKEYSISVRFFKTFLETNFPVSPSLGSSKIYVLEIMNQQKIAKPQPVCLPACLPACLFQSGRTILHTAVLLRKLDNAGWHFTHFMQGPCLVSNWECDASRPNFIALFVHSNFTVRSQNTIYSDYNWLSRTKNKTKNALHNEMVF